MPQSEDIFKETLHKYWGYEDFRGIQREIISSIYEKHDTLGLMPTGGGKSITFQVPAILEEGVCIVITPLVALMKDQEENLKKRYIKASAIHSSMKHSEIITTLENAIFGGVKILYVSPERLSSELFLSKFSHMNVSFITVDEAHCISQWGHDFRPSYLGIKKIREIKPDCPILALTATATEKVILDIQENLGFHKGNVLRMSFHRENLVYIVKESSNKEADLLNILASTTGPAIVYVRSRDKSLKISDILSKNGISSTFYNAGLSSVERNVRQKDWQDGKIRIIVATIAFGMGIDKSDVRTVIHYDCPDSIEGYFQEAGRAGRDGKKSYAILLHEALDDVKLLSRIDQTYPEISYIRDVYDDLAYFFEVGMGSGGGCQFEFDMEEFCKNFKHFPLQLTSALTILTRAGYIFYKEETENIARIKMLVSRDNLYGIEGLSSKDNNVIISLLRNYGGLFSEYCFIDESLIAKQSSLSLDETYHTLKSLNQRDILHFIPRKKIAHIRYERRREESKHLEFPDEVYKIRKEDFANKIEAVLAYIHNNRICRERQLLKYFGQTTLNDCHNCDVCQKEEN